jgi:hypothetical protein
VSPRTLARLAAVALTLIVWPRAARAAAASHPAFNHPARRIVTRAELAAQCP